MTISKALCLTFMLVLGMLFAQPALANNSSATTLAEGIFFSADSTRPSAALRRIDLDGSNETIVSGPLPLQQLIYVAEEDRFYGTALDNTIRRMNADGSEVETLIAGLDGPNSLVLDLANGKMYWMERGSPYLLFGREIRRANLDGSAMETVIDNSAGFGQFYELTLDVVNGKLFVTNDDEILWANLDGSEPGVFTSATGGVNPELSCPLVDGANGKLYWVQVGGSSGNAIYRANLDGTEAQPIVPLAIFPSVSCLLLDADIGEIVWADGNNGTIQRADLDGDNVETLVSGLGTARGLLQGPGGYFYWIELVGGAQNIVRAPRNGTAETLFENFNILRELAVVAELEKLLWINQTFSLWEWEQANLDGSERETLRTSPRDVRGIGLDDAAGKLYLANGQTIARVNLDGSDFEILAETTGFAEGLTLDLLNGKLYWSETGAGAGAIRRANLDGSQVEDIFLHPGGGTPIIRGLVIDSESATLYWSYYIFAGVNDITSSIWRANLDGSNAAPLVTGLGNALGVAVDGPGGKIYWTDSGTRKIQRADLADGGNIEDFIAEDLERPRGIAIDGPNGHLYWSDETADTISRVSLNGGNRTILYSDSSRPQELIIIAQPPDEEPGDEEPGDEEPGDEEPGDEEPGDEEPDSSLYLPFLTTQ